VEATLSFYGVLAGAAAGLFALLFTAIQVREDHWVAKDSLRKVWATAALLELLVVLMTTLIVLMPSHPWHVGPAIGGLGGICSVVWQRHRFKTATTPPDDFDRLQLHLTWVSAAVFGGLLVCGLSPVWAGEHWSVLGTGVLDLAAIHAPSALLTWLIFSGSTEVVLVLMYSDEF
jgi:hypothetical protein